MLLRLRCLQMSSLVPDIVKIFHLSWFLSTIILWISLCISISQTDSPIMLTIPFSAVFITSLCDYVILVWSSLGALCSIKFLPVDYLSSLLKTGETSSSGLKIYSDCQSSLRGNNNALGQGCFKTRNPSFTLWMIDKLKSRRYL